MSKGQSHGYGPSMSDCLRAIENIQDYHKCTVEMGLTLGGASGSLWKIWAIATRTEVEGTARVSGPRVCGVVTLMDSASLLRVDNFLYRLLLELDVVCSRDFWMQRDFWVEEYLA